MLEHGLTRRHVDFTHLSPNSTLQRTDVHIKFCENWPVVQKLKEETRTWLSLKCLYSVRGQNRQQQPDTYICNWNAHKQRHIMVLGRRCRVVW